MKSLEEIFKSQGKAVDELLNIAKVIHQLLQIYYRTILMKQETNGPMIL